MRSVEDNQQPDDPAWRGADNLDGAGPQGTALILELQRLRRALDGDHQKSRPDKHRTFGHGEGRNGQAQAPQPKRRKKSQKRGVERTIDIWLRRVGIKGSVAAEHRRQTPHHPEGSRSTVASRPRRRSPPIVPNDPVLMDLADPEISELGALKGPMLDGSSHTLPGYSAKPEATLAGMIGRYRTLLMQGIAFILDRGDPASTIDGSDDSLLARARWAFERELCVGLRILIVAAILGGGWLVFMPLAGAVVVPGNLVVQSDVKTIQHPTGGVVAEIKVHNGSRVKAGDLLLRLDATQAKAGLEMVSKQLDEVRARIARLVAERDGRVRMDIPAALAARSADETVKNLLASEESLFTARSSARHSQKQLLQGRIAQLTEEISGLKAQLDSKEKQLGLIARELTGVQELYDKRLVPLARLTALQRESAQIDGERGQIISAIAEAKSKIGEAQLQIVRLDQNFRTDVVKQLGDAQDKKAELVERKIAARDLLNRIEIRAPVSGVVNQLSVHTIGGVIRAGETVMQIVPDTENLVVEARLKPSDIDQVRTGQTAFVRFSAFNQRVTPELTGKVSYVSADTSHDQQTHAPYFTVRVVLLKHERRRLAGLQLVPGMPAEVFMRTGSRTMMSYLLRPITDQMRRAFVER